MEKTYELSLTPLQIEVLLDSVRGFVDNKKLLHVPVAGGEIVGLPLTEEALAWLLNVCGQVDEKQSIVVQLASVDDERTKVNVRCPAGGEICTYEVLLAEFDEQ
ncbi:hypothetical protein [Aneurinibacillus aneurinilyticus]|jgi:hypothetical protein|uniref:Uncharacterized protein n=1 Tax=Aneurinibacillus aneurinilyticus ATCC 12856 TaxID=649747 RepID=U1WHN2_ANEAE|nr:hypothetical protein [Aneurinibacillus aneurinilyticus]ERI08094.1 hypothetical protein HMPREF0083_03823 [Aneurinibacillus aneurinilyticus ATCC 12856]MED0670525.1 hypothetical protein [Aneurinibacillus aneurinilyticus]MED0706525.1 hypothetical protein [Aneurinibacillus aneurinilyticus]MED0724410.1 hypothetical protein [Aneurinibacillus aneurinilyticus]MED0730535.1 hypothetical protein [Aneurinibacillus aneurinilyticus]